MVTVKKVTRTAPTEKGVKKKCSKCGSVKKLDAFRRGNVCRSCEQCYDLGRRYGISRAEYDRRSARQLNRCAICRCVGKLVVDHDHGDNAVRALLCDSCNRGLGSFRDNPVFLLKAVEYLEFYS